MNDPTTQLTPNDYFAGALADIGITPALIAKHADDVIGLVDEALIRAGRDDKNMCQWQHVFAGPFYIRTVHIPKGMFLTTGRHLQWHSFYLLSGAASWYDEARKEVLHGCAGTPEGGKPEHFVSLTEPGTRRLIYCHTDVVWSTVHPNLTGCETVEEIEKAICEFPNITHYLQ